MTFYRDMDHDQCASHAILYHNSTLLNESQFKCTHKWHTGALNTTHGKAGETPLPALNISDVPFFREWHHHCPGHWGILMPPFPSPNSLDQVLANRSLNFSSSHMKKGEKREILIYFRWLWPKSKYSWCKKLRCFTFFWYWIFKSSVPILHR